MQNILILLMISFCLAQESGEDIFYEAKPVSKDHVISYPKYIVSVGGGYLFNQDNDLLKKTYSNEAVFSLDVSKYFFQGIYLTLSTSLSKTEVNQVLYANVAEAGEPLELQAFTNSSDFTYLAYYLGISYFTRNSKEFVDPWYFGLGFGGNQFYGNQNSSRFSLLLKFGRVTDIMVLGGHLTFDASFLLYEDIGIFDDPYDYYAAQVEEVLYTSFKLTATLVFDFGEI